MATWGCDPLARIPPPIDPPWIPRGAGPNLICPPPAAGIAPTGAGAAAGTAAPGITAAAGAAGIGAIAGDGGAAAGVTAGALLPRTAAALFPSRLACRLFLRLFAIRFYLRSLFV